MPANLTPQYYALEREFKKENDLYEKLRLAKELLAIIPKHKGTDKLQAELKAKISKLKKQIDGGDKKHGARQVDIFTHIEKEGAAQVIMIGPPNSGKSSLLESLTKSSPLIGDYPYTTREPMVGMMVYDTVQFQLIDTPPISEEHLESYLPNLIRQADIVGVVVDVSTVGFENRLKVLLSILEEKGIILTPDVPDKVDDPRFAYKKAFITAHKFLDESGAEGLTTIRQLFPEFIVVPTSILDDDSLENFKAAIFKSLKIIRVYTKRIGHDVDYVDPVILPIGGTVEDAAYNLHKDFAYKLKFAKVWGNNKFEGQRVKNSYVLADKDVIEFHI
ncbi:MAG: 50S ribosome-binding GTPase [candidate division Zixibacteria bacterium]|nr:50S ribosome-binding GTPase [candidate division Zixibacteria bacterium]